MQVLNFNQWLITQSKEEASKQQVSLLKIIRMHWCLQIDSISSKKDQLLMTNSSKPAILKLKRDLLALVLLQIKISKWIKTLVNTIEKREMWIVKALVLICKRRARI